MADEQLAPEAELDPNAPTEGGDVEQKEPGPIEELASKMGWAPKDQFRGNQDDWKPADEFILASKDINRNLSKELRGMRDQIDRVTRTSAQILEDKLAEKDAYWRGIHAKAVEDGNVELAERASDERGKIREAKSGPQDNGEPPETAEFRSRNVSWFGSNTPATIRAMEVAEQARKLGKDVSGQLDAAEQVVRREFPELFKTASGKAAPVTQTGTSRAAPTSSRTKGFNDMPPESQKMARDYQEKHGVKVEDFAKSYWAEESRRQRRVG